MTARAAAPRLALVALALAGGLLSACLPWPHRQRRAPAIEGVIRSTAGPRAGVRVHRTVNRPPRSAADQCLGGPGVLTDAEGRFAFPELGERLFFFVYGDRLDTWHLCFAPEGEATSVFSDSGWWGGPPEQRLECRLESTPVCRPLVDEE